MSRAFPWLELDDDRKTTLPMGKMVGMVGRGTPWLVPLGTTARPSLENRFDFTNLDNCDLTHISDLTNAKKPLDFTSSNSYCWDLTDIWDLPKWGASRKMRHFTSNGHLKQKYLLGFWRFTSWNYGRNGIPTLEPQGPTPLKLTLKPPGLSLFSWTNGHKLG